MKTINWKRRVGQIVARLTPGQARAIIHTASPAPLLVITGGLDSTESRHHVLRKLAVRAGITI